MAANEEALSSLRELRDFLRHPETYAKLGARIPHGVLLYGPPGTGKTLLARALAGEAGVPFLAMNGSDFVEMYVGVGASRVRDTFKKARKLGRCVIFIDEIDSLGRSRGANSSDERDQTLNALLGEMSGFRPAEGVIVIGATNRAEMLDPALLRPGRFDRRIEVAMPDRDAREKILRLHARGKPMDADVDLSDLAARTVLFSGASLENLLNEAAICAARRRSERICEADIESAYLTLVAGSDRSIRMSEEERRLIALHEAGHAVISRLLAPEDRIRRVSIVPSGNGAAGYNLSIPAEKTMYTRGDLENRICVLLAGRAAETLYAGEGGVTGGASNDLKRATELACQMAGEMGMGRRPYAAENVLQKYGCGAETGADAHGLLEELYERTLSLLSAHADTPSNARAAAARGRSAGRSGGGRRAGGASGGSRGKLVLKVFSGKGGDQRIRKDVLTGSERLFERRRRTLDEKGEKPRGRLSDDLQDSRKNPCLRNRRRTGKSRTILPVKNGRMVFVCCSLTTYPGCSRSRRRESWIIAWRSGFETRSTRRF